MQDMMQHAMQNYVKANADLGLSYILFFFQAIFLFQYLTVREREDYYGKRPVFKAVILLTLVMVQIFTIAISVCSVKADPENTVTWIGLVLSFALVLVVAVKIWSECRS